MYIDLKYISEQHMHKHNLPVQATNVLAKI